MKRRTFLVGTALAGTGALVVGFRVWDASFDRAARRLVETRRSHLLAGWVLIDEDDAVTVLTPGVDVGQGAQTALAMMLAEELDADWAKVRAEHAPADEAFADRFLVEGYVLKGQSLGVLQGAANMIFAEVARFMSLQMTGGSTAVAFTGQYGLRVVGAAAREMLLSAAATRLGADVRELETSDGTVVHRPSGRVLRYGALAAAAAREAVPARPRLKPRDRYTLVGRSVPRLDIPSKVTGALRYGIDMVLPDMRYAAVQSAPVHGGCLLHVDPKPALAIKQVERVVPLVGAVAVVARNYWAACKGLAALSPTYSDGGNGGVSSDLIFERQLQALNTNSGKIDVTIGDVGATFTRNGVRIATAEYRVPFLAHAPIEPINATAQFKDGRLTVWTGDRDPLASRMAVARAIGLSSADVAFHALPCGGCFGARSVKNSAADIYLAHAAEIARVMSPFPVKMIRCREEDFTQDAFRPQLMSRIRGAVDPQGKLVAWEQIYIAGAPSLATAFDIPYSVPNKSIRSVTVPHHVRIGSWRSVNSSQHAFWAESFIDELAHAGGTDPYASRRAALAEGSREQRVLEAVAKASNWGAPLPVGVGRGIALAPSFGTIVAEVIEASWANGGAPQVHRVVAAVDCGDIVHPDTAEQQVEGAIIMGLSAALHEEITIRNGHVTQSSFPDYPVLKLAEIPEIEVHFVRSGAPLGGLGEVGLPPVVPALTNALFAATGRRIRRLPICNV
jgi:isoquinoline 1-oxidoreductase subunit beta